MLKIRARPFYNARHTYVSYMLSIGATSLFVCRQTATSLKMIEEHYGSVNVLTEELDSMIEEARSEETRNPPGNPTV